jgi:hypothetical protein
MNQPRSACQFPDLNLDSEEFGTVWVVGGGGGDYVIALIHVLSFYTNGLELFIVFFLLLTTSLNTLETLCRFCFYYCINCAVMCLCAALSSPVHVPVQTVVVGDELILALVVQLALQVHVLQAGQVGLVP